jgi:acyl-coenzyme A thioesterase 13
MQTIHGGTIASLVDLGGSLAVASTGRFMTGVSTDLNGMYGLNGGFLVDCACIRIH